jgi:hypothetical protein
MTIQRKKDNRPYGFTIQTKGRLGKGEKWIILGEIIRGPKLGRMKILRYSKEWSFEELSDHLDRLQYAIWEEEWPAEAMLKQYLDFTYHYPAKLPTNIRVPKDLKDMIEHERKLEQQEHKRIRREMDEEAAASPKAKKPPPKVKR